MLISHHDMSQYASALPEEILNTWQKVEGRYNAVNVRQGSAKTYQLISAVIKKDPDQWVEYRTASFCFLEAAQSQGNESLR